MSSEIKEIKNVVYHAAVVSGLSVAYSMLLKNLLQVSPPNLGKLDMSDDLKLVGIVSVSIMTRDWLVSQKIIPEKMYILFIYLI